MSWDVSREGCLDDWQRRIWDSARKQGFSAGYQAGVVNALDESVSFIEDKGFDVPRGLRDAILSLIDGEDA